MGTRVSNRFLTGIQFVSSGFLLSNNYFTFEEAVKWIEKNIGYDIWPKRKPTIQCEEPRGMSGCCIAMTYMNVYSGWHCTGQEAFEYQSRSPNLSMEHLVCMFAYISHLVSAELAYKLPGHQLGSCVRDSDSTTPRAKQAATSSAILKSVDISKGWTFWELVGF